MSNVVISEGPGLYRFYKDGGHKDFEASEVQAALDTGWHDNPTDGAKSSPADTPDPGDTADDGVDVSQDAPPTAPEPNTSAKRRRGRPPKLVRQR